jgi:hypothetical protein
LQGGSSKKGLIRNELLLKRAHISGDVSKLTTTFANYVFRSSFMTWTPHTRGKQKKKKKKIPVCNFIPNAKDICY